ncbi:unnamed protein product [Vitrella brassicaformis CCMP3155]|uniref:Protein kinase domain-containing protein n=1 Tax=Vitrella brassicaformis (strain CCMP3155) TaxID=1169540 RepID=A0A0G4EV07_VITBC|nr:unnamed protein product [Vitrella brassicaformis CCMP3155]|eukprot:CEM02436.1 unnamed protein product [Vitrella brassicaformis CCMP3155]
MELFEAPNQYPLGRYVSKKGGNPSPHLLDPAEIKALAFQTLMVLAWLHEKGMAHRDLQPDNLFGDRSRVFTDLDAVKLIDFGFATHPDGDDWQQEGEGELVGTPGYYTPEGVFKQALMAMNPDAGKDEDTGKTRDYFSILRRNSPFEADIYQFGQLFYEAHIGEPLYEVPANYGRPGGMTEEEYFTKEAERHAHFMGLPGEAEMPQMDRTVGQVDLQLPWLITPPHTEQHHKSMIRNWTARALDETAVDFYSNQRWSAAQLLSHEYFNDPALTQLKTAYADRGFPVEDLLPPPTPPADQPPPPADQQPPRLLTLSMCLSLCRWPLLLETLLLLLLLLLWPSRCHL